MSAAVEIPGDKLVGKCAIGRTPGSETAVAVIPEPLRRTVDHTRREHTVLLVDCPLLHKLVSRISATHRQLGEPLATRGIFRPVYIDIDISIGGYLVGVGHLESVTERHSKRTEQSVDIS